VVRSTKDLTKAINAYILAPSLPLPDDLNEVIAGYLERHEKYDDAASDRLQEELTQIYYKSVTGHPARYAPFLALLRPLRPALRSPARIVQWWDRFIDPVLENLNTEKGLAAQALRSVLELVVFEEDEYDKLTTEGPNIFADRLLSRWMELNALNQAATGSGSSSSKETFMREAIMVFGKRDPRSFLVALNSFFVKKEYRNRCLNLLCEFVQSQPPHLHLVLHTPLFDNILKSLQQDDSTTTVSLGLVSLFMLLPNMPSSLVPYLPTLFNIYARLLFWDRDRSFAQEHTQWGAESGNRPGASAGWDKCLFDNDLDGDSIHHLGMYFTILYGLYPLNFVDYIRKPQRYLRHANNTDDVDVQAMEIRDRSERFRRCHLLHPNFYQLTVDSEKTDFSRWLRSEPAEVITDCVNLCTLTDEGGGPYEDRSEPSTREPIVSPPNESLPMEHGSDQPLLSRTSSPSDSKLSAPGAVSANDAAPVQYGVAPSEPMHGPAQSSLPSRSTSVRASIDPRARDLADHSPSLAPQLPRTASHAQIQDMINSNKVIKSDLHQLANDSVPSLALSHSESLGDHGSLQLQAPHRSIPSPNSAELTNQLALLQRQNLLLQNDLNFERYMKQQHMTHVGALRRKQLREAATEAETQNLVMANRSMKYRLEESQRKEAQIRKEADRRKQMSKRWDTSQSSKLAQLREQQKAWSADETRLRNEIAKLSGECEQLRQKLGDMEAGQLKSQQDSQAFEASKEEIRKLKEEVQQLSASQRKYQGMERKMEKSIAEAAQAEARARTSVLEITERENQLLRELKSNESQIGTLKAQLEELRRANQKQEQFSKVTSMQESSLRNVQNKYAELQKQYALMKRKYQAAQASLLDLQCDMEEKRTEAYWAAQSAARNKSVDSSNNSSSSETSLGIKNRTMSDPELQSGLISLEGTFFNSTAPLPARNKPAGKAPGLGFQYHSRPVTGDGSSDGRSQTQEQGRTASLSGSERYFYGRGKLSTTRLVWQD
jgi:hypothetical protein